MPGDGDGSIVQLEEEVDKDYDPTGQEVIEYAEWLGMDVEADKDLLWIARQGLKAPLPHPWKPCQTAEDGEVFYFNHETGESVWDHPCDDYHRKLYKAEKAKRGGGGDTEDLGDNSASDALSDSALSNSNSKSASGAGSRGVGLAAAGITTEAGDISEDDAKNESISSLMSDSGSALGDSLASVSGSLSVEDERRKDKKAKKDKKEKKEKRERRDDLASSGEGSGSGSGVALAPKQLAPLAGLVGQGAPKQLGPLLGPGAASAAKRAAGQAPLDLGDSLDSLDSITEEAAEEDDIDSPEGSASGGGLGALPAVREESSASEEENSPAHSPMGGGEPLSSPAHSPSGAGGAGMQDELERWTSEEEARLEEQRAAKAAELQAQGEAATKKLEEDNQAKLVKRRKEIAEQFEEDAQDGSYSEFETKQQKQAKEEKRQLEADLDSKTKELEAQAHKAAEAGREAAASAEELRKRCAEAEAECDKLKATALVAPRSPGRGSSESDAERRRLEGRVATLEDECKQLRTEAGESGKDGAEGLSFLNDSSVSDVDAGSGLREDVASAQREVAGLRAEVQESSLSPCKTGERASQRLSELADEQAAKGAEQLQAKVERLEQENARLNAALKERSREHEAAQAAGQNGEAQIRHQPGTVEHVSARVDSLSRTLAALGRIRDLQQEHKSKMRQVKP